MKIATAIYVTLLSLFYLACKEPTVQKKFFDTITEKELTLLKQTKVERSPSIHARNNLLLDFLFYSGVRINELTNIKHQD